MAPERIAAIWRRARSPGTPALHKGVRVAVAATLGFLIGRYAIDDPQTAVFGALTPIGLLALGDVGGPLALRVRAYLFALLCMAFLVVVGTVVSEDTLAASLATFAVVLLISQAAIAGRNAEGLGRALVLVLVVSSGIPAADETIPDRLVGVAIGGMLAVGAALLLWPEHPGHEFRGRLGTALRPLAELARLLSSYRPMRAEIARERAAAREALASARPFALGVVERPAGPAAVDTAQRLLVPGIERLDELLDEIVKEPPVVDGRGLPGPTRELLRALAAELGRAADLLTGRASDPPASERLEAARKAFAADSEAHLADLLDGNPDGEAFARSCDADFRVHRVAATAVAVVAEARLASRHARGPADFAIGEWPAPTPLRRLAARARTNITLDSVVLRNGLRLALGLAAARAVAGAFDLEHGFWVEFATLVVIRSTIKGTGATAVKAVLGTALGAVLATGLLFAFEAEADVYVGLMPLFAFLSTYMASISLVLGQMAFTLLIVALFNLAAPPQWDIGLIRIEDIAIGTAVGLAIGAAAWPRGATAQLRRALAEAIDAGVDDAAGAARRLLHASGGGGAAALHLHAVRAARRAEDVFTAYLAEAVDRRAALDRWADLVERTNRLWYGAGVMAGARPLAEHGCDEFVASLEDHLDRVAAGYRDAGEALRNRGELPPPPRRQAADELGAPALGCIALAADGHDRVRLEAVARLFGFRAWIAELADKLDGLRGEVEATAVTLRHGRPPA
jgi:uncharacterized membrane protein YccC